jgi:hypothetical protein
LFELGRYAAASLTQAGKARQWYIHRRLLTSRELDALQEPGRPGREIVELVYKVVTGRSTRPSTGQDHSEKRPSC